MKNIIKIMISVVLMNFNANPGDLERIKRNAFNAFRMGAIGFNFEEQGLKRFINYMFDFYLKKSLEEINDLIEKEGNSKFFNGFLCLLIKKDETELLEFPLRYLCEVKKFTEEEKEDKFKFLLSIVLTNVRDFKKYWEDARARSLETYPKESAKKAEREFKKDLVFVVWLGICGASFLYFNGSFVYRHFH